MRTQDPHAVLNAVSCMCLQSIHITRALWHTRSRLQPPDRRDANIGTQLSQGAPTRPQSACARPIARDMLFASCVKARPDFGMPEMPAIWPTMRATSQLLIPSLASMAHLQRQSVVTHQSRPFGRPRTKIMKGYMRDAGVPFSRKTLTKMRMINVAHTHLRSILTGALHGGCKALTRR